MPLGWSPQMKLEWVVVHMAPMLLNFHSWTTAGFGGVPYLISAKPKRSLDGQSIWETPERCLKFESFYNKKKVLWFFFLCFCLFVCLFFVFVFVFYLYLLGVVFVRITLHRAWLVLMRGLPAICFSSPDESCGTLDFTFSSLKCFSSFIEISSNITLCELKIYSVLLRYSYTMQNGYHQPVS